MDKYLEIPNIPSYDAGISLAVVDGRIGIDILNKLESLNINIIKTEKVPGLYDAVSYHPDMMLHHLGGKKIILAPNVNSKLVYDLEGYGFEILFGNKEVGSKYPYNVAYNAARVGNYLICNSRYTDETILNHGEKNGLTLINVKQGYSKCSICILGSNAIITSDAGINSTIYNGKYDIDCCLIQPGEIELTGMDYGFIGGATGLLSYSQLGIFGDIFIHSNYEKINDFLVKYSKKIFNLGKNKIKDYGTLIPLKEYSILTK